MNEDELFIHVKNISKSFAHCIAILDPPQREWIALAYLMCRTIDTIEDANWRSQAERNALFELFNARLNNKKIRISEQLKDFPKNLNEAEKALMSEVDKLFRRYDALPNSIQHIFRETLLHMSMGMQYFSNHYMTNGAFQISTIAELNQYCFFAAGVVGELLTKLYTYQSNTFHLSNEVMLNAFHYGFFLQKVNILKDIKADKAAGKSYFVSLEAVKLNLYVNARGALAYLKSLPIQTHANYRLSCAWIVFTNLASLSWINESIANDSEQKMPDKVATDIMEKVRTIINDDEALEHLFSRFSSEWPSTVNSSPIAFSPNWYTRLYNGSLSQQHMTQLGMVS